MGAGRGTAGGAETTANASSILEDETAPTRERGDSGELLGPADAHELDVHGGLGFIGGCDGLHDGRVKRHAVHRSQPQSWPSGETIGRRGDRLALGHIGLPVPETSRLTQYPLNQQQTREGLLRFTAGNIFGRLRAAGTHPCRGAYTHEVNHPRMLHSSSIQDCGRTAAGEQTKPRAKRENWYRLPGSNGGPLDPQSSALTN